MKMIFIQPPRLFLAIFACAILLMASCNKNESKGTEIAEERPNIIFILADDQRANTIHRLGNEDIKTPTMDSLSSVGTTFTNNYIMGAMNAAVCAPSRAMLMTGRNLFHITPSGDDIESVNTTLPEQLQAYGYTTFHTGKWHNGKEAFVRSFTSGDQIFFGGMSDHYNVPLQYFDSSGNYPNDGVHYLQQHSTDIYAQAAVKFLEEEQSERPFFMFVAFQAPHDPRQVPEKYLQMYDADEIALWPNFMPEHSFDNGEMGVRDEMLIPTPRSPEDVKMHIAAYYAMVTHIDEAMGKIMTALQASGKADNTYIIFAADNGLALGAHGLLGKQSIYEHSIKVPLIISGPGLPQDRVSTSGTYLFDIYPTIMELAKTPIPETVQGKSLVSILQGDTTGNRQDMVFGYKNSQRALRTGDLKLILYNVKGVYHTQLYNLKDDPWEMNNLSSKAEWASKIDSMKQHLNTLLASAGDSVDFDKAQWGVPEIPSWAEKMQKNNPDALGKFRKMAEEENDMVKGYWKED
ncbi:MAG: sulfatase-like hydrolase/transferase [Cyclobacteriaceae bacterium]|nr:sulfatase-like hydrolase/transferase [Cyclobacteriaceae bacterium]